MGETDAQVHENEIRWHHAGVTVGSGFAASAWLVGSARELCSGLCLPEKADALEAVSPLQEPGPSDRLWHHRGRLQDCVHTKAQMLGDVVDDRGWASHRGPPCGLVEWRLE